MTSSAIFVSARRNWACLRDRYKIFTVAPLYCVVQSQVYPEVSKMSCGHHRFGKKQTIFLLFPPAIVFIVCVTFVGRSADSHGAVRPRCTGDGCEVDAAKTVTAYGQRNGAQRRLHMHSHHQLRKKSNDYDPHSAG